MTLSCPPGCLPLPHLINSISLPPLSFHLISSTSPSAPSPCALAAAPSCCAGWEIPSCSPWGGFGWVLWGALYPCQPPASPWGWQSIHPTKPSSTCRGGNCPVAVKRKVQVVAIVCWVEQGPPAPCPGMCHQRGAQRGLCPGQGRHLTLVPLSLQSGNPLAFYFISYQHRNEPCFVLSFSGALGSSHSRENTPKPPIWLFPRSAKEPHQGLLQKSTPKWQIWKHGFLQT